MVNSSKAADQRFWNRWEASGALGWHVPPPCDREVFAKGESVAALDARMGAAENWVRRVAHAADARIDWHYSGGRAHVLHLGDSESRQRVVDAMQELEPRLRGTILYFIEPGDPGLHRRGVTPVPAGVLATS